MPSASRTSWPKAARCCARWARRTALAWRITSAPSLSAHGFCCACTRRISASSASPSGLEEPVARSSLAAGASVVSFSGDKLLGGPQAGIIAGKKELVERVRHNPLFRALRVDKLTIAALEVTLGSYQRGALDEIPAIAMIRATPQEIEERSRNFIRELTPSLAMDGLDIEIADGESLAGGGSTPAQSLASKVIRIRSERRSSAQIEQRLRRGAATSVVARIEDDSLVLDLR